MLTESSTSPQRKEVGYLLKVFGNSAINNCDGLLISSILSGRLSLLSGKFKMRYRYGGYVWSSVMRDYDLKRGDIPEVWELSSSPELEVCFVEIDLHDSEGYKYGNLVCEVGDVEDPKNCIVVCKLAEKNGQLETTHTQAFSINESGDLTVYPIVKREGARMKWLMELMEI